MPHKILSQFIGRKFDVVLEEMKNLAPGRHFAVMHDCDVNVDVDETRVCVYVNDEFQITKFAVG